ncbi:FMRFamide-activated amiloride-sensitive sodium channel isoform X1 [Octopus bimaculoides]|nr:FMRFamide-activated amiloride-sensitive sodium channel isoform X1 [Octopus bimaculoides]
MTSSTIRVRCTCGAPLCNSNNYEPMTRASKPGHMKVTGFDKLGFNSNQLRTMRQQLRRRNYNALSIITELAAESNAHGLAKIATSTQTPRKVLWALMVIVGFTAATLQLSLLVRKYLEFQVVEVSKMKDGMDVEFPAITVCNIAPISLTKTKELLSSDTSELTQWLRFIDKYNFGAQTDRMFTVQSLYENLADEAQLLGRDLNDFLIHCQYNQEICNIQNFTRYFDGHYFNCYTFNSGHQTGTSLLTHATGPQSGLSLILSLDNDDPPVGGYGSYNIKSNIEHSAGVRVVVHPPSTMPSPVDHGFDVPPGYSSSVGLKTIMHARLSNPYGNCQNSRLQNSSKYIHTVFSCLELCKQRIVMSTCGCRSSNLPEMTSANFTFCGLVENKWNWKDMMKNPENYNITKINLTELACEERVLKEFSINRAYESSCNCFQPCQETTYQKSISLSYWPLEFNQLSALETFYGDKINETFLHDAYKMLKYLSNLGSVPTPESPPPEEINITVDDNNNSTNSRMHSPALLSQLLANSTEAPKPAATRDDFIEHVSAKLNSSDKEKQIRASNMIRQNLLRLNVYLEDLSIIEFRQMPAYELADLFADIGGTLGLWMGISVLTIMELIELFTRLLMLIFSSEKKIPNADPVTNGMLDHDCDCQKSSMESPF